MAEKDKKMDIAVFRFGIIAEFVTGVRLEPGEKARLLRKKTSRVYSIPHSRSSTIGESTIRRWIQHYRNAGNRIEGLMPSDRKDKGIFRVFDESLQLAIKEIKQEKPELVGTALVNELRHRKYIGADENINMSVLYRFLKKHQLERPRQIDDRRAFEALHPNELWQSDVMHGPAVVIDGKRKKSYLIAILDDHSRLITHAQFYSSEKLADFKDCLRQAIMRRGLPTKLYIDNGSCYKAINLDQVTACLGIGIVHTPPYTPQGRGKIERWFRYVRESFLTTVPQGASLDEINELFVDWVEYYHNRVHSTTQQEPLKRYQSNMKCVRPAPPDLLNYFRFIEFRRVKRDRTVRLNGVIFEVPVDLIDYRVELRFHRESPEEVEVFYDEKSYGMATVLSRNTNFKIGRNGRPVADDQVQENVSPGELFQEVL